MNNPKPIGDYKYICKLMDVVNTHPSTTGDMDACHISCFPTSKATLKLHKDDESLISQTSSICTVSIGPPRNLEFVLDTKKAKNNEYIPADYSVPAIDRTMNVVKPGAQFIMRHRVPKGEHIPSRKNYRYSLSFRKINRQDEHIDMAPSVTYPLDDEKVPDKDPPQSPEPTTQPPQHKKKIILVAGDSFPSRLEAPALLLAKGKKTVVNIAKGGSKINVVMKDIMDYVEMLRVTHLTKL